MTGQPLPDQGTWTVWVCARGECSPAMPRESICRCRVKTRTGHRYLERIPVEVVPASERDRQVENLVDAWHRDRDRLAGEVERLREALAYFALDDTTFHDPDEPDNPHTSVGVSVTRAFAAKIRDLCAASDDSQETT